MNERIKELVGKTLDSEFSHTWDTMTYEGLLQFSEKFAELIVSECAKIADDGCGSACFGLGINGAMLLQHFGIEE